MKKRVWMALCLQACLLAACSSEMTDPPVGADNGWLEVNFTNPETRTSLDDSGAGSFSDGDKVGLYIDNGSSIAYRELTYSGGHWLPLLQRSDFGDGELTLAAHYPVQKGADEVDKAREFNFSLSQDQNNGGSPRRICSSAARRSPPTRTGPRSPLPTPCIACVSNSRAM